MGDHAALHDTGNRRRHLRHYPNGPGDNRRPVTAAKPRPKNKVTPFLGTLSEALRAHSAACKLTKMDRRTLADHIQRADAIGTGAYAMLARLLSKKLLYASVFKADEPCGAIARAGSRVTYAIDDLSSQEGRLFHGNAYALGQDGIPIASLLGATLIGMSSSSDAPFLQADGSFHRVRLISVDHQATPLYCET